MIAFYKIIALNREKQMKQTPDSDLANKNRTVEDLPPHSLSKKYQEL